MEQQKQVNIQEMDLVELWRTAFEQQQALTQLLAQINQTQANIQAIQAEIASREPKETK